MWYWSSAVVMALLLEWFAATVLARAERKLLDHPISKLGGFTSRKKGILHVQESGFVVISHVSFRNGGIMAIG
jgi:hypothetical protein